MKTKKTDKPAREIAAADEAFQLAQLAVPFAAAGMPDEQALERAAGILAKAAVRLAQPKEDARQAAGRDAFTTDLAGVKQLLPAADDRTVKKLVLRLLGKDEGGRVWRRALRGERVFTPGLWGAMKAEKARTGRGSAGVRAGKLGEVFEKNLLTALHRSFSQ